MKLTEYTIHLNKETTDKLNELTAATNYLCQDGEKLTPEDIIKGSLAYYLDRFYENTVSSAAEMEKVIPLSSNYPLKNKIGEILDTRPISKLDIAAQLKISKGTLSGIINNRHQPSLDIFVRLWVMLGCPPLHEILYREIPD